MKTKIAQIIPYFGKWPEWFDLYIYSCGNNQMVDFIFYTDCPTPKTIYDNTKFINVSLEEYCNSAGRRLGIDYKIKNPYKLTDLKPFLGFIHQENLMGYEWWGFGDIDLVFGDLSILVNDKNLKKYNLITSHNYHIAGHFTIMKNNEYYRNLCFKIKDWQSKLCDDKHYGLDEAEWSNLVYSQLKYPSLIYHKFLKYFNPKCYNKFMDLSNSILNPKELFKEFHTTPIPKEEEKWIYEVKSGQLKSLNDYKIPYLHFLFFKKTPWLQSENYWRNEFYQLDEIIEKYNKINITIEGINGVLKNNK